MFAFVHNLSAYRLVCVLFFLSALPAVALSQEETIDPINTATSTDLEITTTPQTQVSNFVPANNVYRTEPLLGDKVFGDFVLGPGKVELTISPGESKTIELDVANRIGETKIFEVDVEDMGGSSDATKAVVLLGDDTGPYTLKDYISVPARSFELEHNKRALVPVTISIPPDAEPGGRYGSVLVKTVAHEANDGASKDNPVPSSAIISRIGTLFFITVPGEVEKSGELQKFSTTNDKKWYQEGPIDFQILYENTGSIHLNPYGELRITNMLGEEVGFVELEPWFSLPQSLRLREISWTRELLYGRYTATLLLNRGYDDVVEEASYTFWVIPWKIILGALAILFVIFFIIRGFFRKFEFRVKEK